MKIGKTVITIFALLASIDALSAKVIIVSIDGLRPDAITNWGSTALPHFYRLRNEGAFTDNARTIYHHTTTLPNHTSMITGRPSMGPCGHQLTVNSGNNNLHRRGYISSVFDVAHDHGLSTALFAGKSKFFTFITSYNSANGAPDLIGEDNGRNKIDHAEISTDDEYNVTSFINQLTDQPWDLSFLHIRLPDSLGHGFDWEPWPGSEYMSSIRAADSHLGEILNAIENTPSLAGQTHIILTADHGGTQYTYTHTNPVLLTNYRIPFYVWGPNVKAAADLYALNPSFLNPGNLRPDPDEPQQPIRNAMAGNLALSLLNLPAIPGSCHNVLQTLRVNAPLRFSSLYPDLDPASDANDNGTSNFYDYAIGADPLGETEPDLQPRFENDRLIIFRRRGALDVTFDIQTSPDLLNWHTLQEGITYITESIQDISADTQQLHLRVPQLASRAYFRIVVRPL